MQRSPKDDAAVAAKLSAVLDAHRETLSRLPGVMGTGVGVASSGRAGEAPIVIQIFVTPSADLPAVQRLASEIVGPEHPVEVINMPVPRGDTGGTGSVR